MTAVTRCSGARAAIAAKASLWANDVFANARLNGGDEQQAFILLRRSAEEADTLVALYSVTRGNRRAYLHVEEFVAGSPLGELLPTAATVLREMRDTGKLDYPDRCCTARHLGEPAGP